MSSRNGPMPPVPQPTADEMLHFFNQSPDLLCIAGFDGRFKCLNPAWSPLLGWSNSELQARPFLDFVHPDDHPATLAVMSDLDSGADTIFFENRYRCQDGSWKWLRWTASPSLDRREIYAIARDVTCQKELELQILAASEREQHRISLDLHDSLGPHLAAIRYAATFLADELDRHDPAAAAKARRIGVMSADAVIIARDLAHGIFPVRLESLGLAQVLRDLAETTSRQTGLLVTFSQCGDTLPTKPADDLQLYRIAQEALSNSAKHGAARKVGIVLHYGEKTLSLTVADDGVGISPCPAPARGMGLDSMSHRARSLGGKITLDSNPRRGTTITCEVPMPPPLHEPSLPPQEKRNPYH